MIFGEIEDNPYPPHINSMIEFLKKEGASDTEIEKIGFENAAKLLKL